MKIKINGIATETESEHSYGVALPAGVRWDTAVVEFEGCGFTGYIVQLGPNNYAIAPGTRPSTADIRRQKQTIARAIALGILQRATK